MTNSSWREPSPSSTLQEQRCKACRKLLCKSDGRGRVEVVCPKCGTLNTFRTG